MKNSRKLIEQVCAGEIPERTPIFDLLCNDAVVAHYAGEPLNGDNDMAKMLAAAGRALDGTRSIFPPMVAGTTWTDGMGNIREAARWTSWIRHHALADADAWATWIGGHIERLEATPTPGEAERAKTGEEQQAYNANLNGTVNIFCTPSTGINTALFGYCGLEIFSYLWADERELVLRWMRALERERQQEVIRSAHANHSPLAMIYSDVAYKQHLMFSQETFNEFGFFNDVEDICAQCHEYDMTVIFHSDGYIMDIVDDLVACGIDGLNPIEKAAGMDVYELHQKYPDLIIVGGLDVTHLLPFGTPDEVRAETRRMINEIGADGKLLIGSSTEMEDNVPLENYLAFHDEVMKGSIK
jgi:hypothetical protein